jgi:hypothetical protein
MNIDPSGKSLTDYINNKINYVGDKINQATDYVGDKINQATDYVGDKINQLKSSVGSYFSDQESTDQKSISDNSSSIPEKISESPVSANTGCKTGWREEDDKWHYFDSSGQMKTGWMQYGNSWYYLDRNSGEMQTGWMQDDNTWYYLDKDSGNMQTNKWIQSNYSDDLYYVGSDGQMLQSTGSNINGIRYGFNSDGVAHAFEDTGGDAQNDSDVTDAIFILSGGAGYLMKKGVVEIGGKIFVKDAGNYVLKEAVELSRAQIRNLETLDNIVEGHLTDMDFSGTLRDLLGDPVPKPGGGYWNHLQEMKDSYAGLIKIRRGIEGSLNNPNLSDVARQVLQSGLDKAKVSINKIEELFMPFGGIE